MNSRSGISRLHKYLCKSIRSSQIANWGALVRSTRRQSMPSNNIDSWARLSNTVPLVVCGQINRPRSSLFENRQNPSPSCQMSLIRSPRRPRNTNTLPDQTTSQIGDSRSYPNPRTCRRCNHRDKHSSTARTASASALPVMRTWAFAKLTSIVPHPASRFTTVRLPASISSLTLTGSKCTPPVSGFSSNPARYSFRQWNNRLAFIPCARATAATDAPGLSASSMICRFSSAPRYRRVLRLARTAGLESSISSPFHDQLTLPCD